MDDPKSVNESVTRGTQIEVVTIFVFIRGSSDDLRVKIIRGKCQITYGPQPFHVEYPV